MEENVLISSTRYDVKKACIIILILGTLLSLLLLLPDWSASMESYNRLKQIYLEHQEKGSCSIFDSKEKCWDCEHFESNPTKLGYILGNTIAYITNVNPSSLIIFVAACLISGLSYLWLHSYELTITDKRVYGKAAFGTRIDLPVDSVSAIATVSLLRGIAISTSSGRIRFLVIKNAEEIYRVVSNLLIKRQQEMNQVTAKASVQTDDETDQLKKYKELLDSGVITQEEFYAKKKQLLGL